MSGSVDPVELRRAATAAARQWPAAKLSMALRAINAEAAGESLDAIAIEFDVSRETVRRARNELVHGIGETGSADVVAGLPEIAKPTMHDPATARAFRRLLTMTGPLSWEEVLAAWSRGGGKPPYVELPTHAATFHRWAADIDGVVVREGDQPAFWVTEPEELDAVSTFLLTQLRERPRGLERTELLKLAEKAGLKTTTIATALSTHPAVVRLGRGMWALRGHVGVVATKEAVEPRRVVRTRPTTFAWGINGALELTFSIPRGPSPVLAVPKAIAPLVDGREFEGISEDKAVRVVVKNGKLWGFAPLVSSAGLWPGARGVLALNLISGTANLSACVKGAGDGR